MTRLPPNTSLELDGRAAAQADPVRRLREMLKKPATKSDLLPPFGIVGEPGWQRALHDLLASFDVPAGKPVRAEELAMAEERLGVALPSDWQQILLHLGPPSFGPSSWVSPGDIVFLDNVWFRDLLESADRSDLAGMLLVATTGSDNCYCYDPASGLVHLGSHDPAGVFERIPSVGELLRFELLGLSCGYNGWPDDYISDMVEELQQEWLEAWSSKQ